VDDLTLSCLANQYSIVQTTSCFLTSFFKTQKVAVEVFLKEYSKEKPGTKKFDGDDSVCVCETTFKCQRTELLCGRVV